MARDKVRYVIVNSKVEYETIIPEKLCDIEYWPNPEKTEMSFKALIEKRELVDMFRDEDYFKPEEVKNSSSYIYIILYNTKLDEIKYRMHTLVILGDSEPNSMQVYQISTKEFNWSTLNVALFDEKGENIQLEVVKWI